MFRCSGSEVLWFWKGSSVLWAGMTLLLLPHTATALLLHPQHRRVIRTRARGAAVMQAEERWTRVMQPSLLGDSAPLPRLELSLDSGGSGTPPREPPSGGGDGRGGGDDESGGGRRDVRWLMLGPWAATQWALQVRVGEWVSE